MARQTPWTPWTRPEIIALLNRSDEAVSRAILHLYKRQTDIEKGSEATYDRNNRGFNAASARSGSYMAKWLLARPGRILTGKFLDKGRRFALRHVRQLLAHANQQFTATNRQPGDELMQIVG